MIIYDIEIKKCIPPYKGQPKSEYEYCAGWHDHKEMGVSSITVYDYNSDEYHVFMDDNMDDFRKMLSDEITVGDPVIGFNSLNFDNKVIYANGLVENLEELDAVSYDLLQEIWKAVSGTEGRTDNFNPAVHAGYGLDIMCSMNNIGRKSGNGALAPENFQDGRYGTLINYNLHDVWLTKQLFDFAKRNNRALNSKIGLITLPENPIYLL